MKPRLPALLSVACLLPALLGLGACAPAPAGARRGVVLVLDGSPAGLEARREVELLLSRSPVGAFTLAERPAGKGADLSAFLAGVAKDRSIGAIVLYPAPLGSAEAFSRLHAARPELLLLAGSPAEDPLVIQAAADLVAGTDLPGLAWRAAKTARAAGAASLWLLGSAVAPAGAEAARLRSLLAAAAARLGLGFREERLPAGGAAALAAAVRERVAAAGKGAAWFCGEEALVAPLVGSLIGLGGFYVGSPSPSPRLGFPAGFGISPPEERRALLSALDGAAREAGVAGRFSSWAWSADGSIAAALAEIARRAVDAPAPAVAAAAEQAGEAASSAELLPSLAGADAPAPAGFRIDSLEELAAALRAVAPGSAGELSYYTDPSTGVRARNHVLFLEQEHFLGGGPAVEKGETPAELRLVE